MRLNLGCGHLPLDGYTNVDQHASEADVLGDVRELTFADVEEVVMHHLLEHLPLRDAIPTLERIRSWMQPGATISVEVPDMEQLMANPRAHFWLTDIYGSQEHEGEFHRSGYTAQSLGQVLQAAGFQDIRLYVFTSRHPSREGLPCIEATATA